MYFSAKCVKDMLLLTDFNTPPSEKKVDVVQNCTHMLMIVRVERVPDGLNRISNVLGALDLTFQVQVEQDKKNQALLDTWETFNSSAQDCHTCITPLQWFATKDTNIQYNIVSSRITMFAAIQYPSLP